MCLEGHDPQYEKSFSPLLFHDFTFFPMQDSQPRGVIEVRNWQRDWLRQ
jgi:hypothetical protein